MITARQLFRIVYGSIYLVLYVILLALLLITPADAIIRSIQNRQTYNIWILVIFYVVTVLIVTFIYLMRLYVNKTVLTAIPKSTLPIKPGDVNRAVHAIIEAGLERSAAIAFEARPSADPNKKEGQPGERVVPPASEGLGISRTLQSRIWDDIEHHGWSSPNLADLPNLQYSTVLSELPNLIEAKALTLAPPDPASQSDPPVLDPEAVALLQKPSYLSLRGYIDQLTSLGVLDIDDTAASFLERYEYARFSTRPISNAKFRELMHLFAEMLRSMQTLDLEALDAEQELQSYTESFVDQSNRDGAMTPRSQRSKAATVSSQSSVRRPMRSSSWNLYRTAPNTPHSTARVISRKSSSSNSFAQSRNPYHMDDSRSPSPSIRSGSSASVIRLSTNEDNQDGPYVLNLSGTAESLSPAQR
jgi:hypothetical protein